MTALRSGSRYAAALAAALTICAGPAPAEITVECVDPSLWGAADEAIGLGGGVVEDFEDTALAPGLAFEISDVDGNFTGVGATTLPGLFDPVDGDPFGDTFAEGVWDGTYVLVNTEFNESIYYGSRDWRPVAFRVPDGTAWIALAGQQITVNHDLWVNDVNVGRLADLGFALGPGRNGVMIVRSDDPEDPVRSVRFGGRGDAFVIDHVVFAAPGSVGAERTSWGGLKALFREPS
jgi:hypothetical protein